MAILQQQIGWLGERDFPNGEDQELDILEYREVPGKKGKDRELVVRLCRNGDERVLTIWGDNLNRLIKTLGSDTVKWENKRIKMSVQRIDGKLMRIVR